MIQKLFVTIFLILFSFNNSYANIIRDSEIEETINLVIAPLKTVSGIQDLKIFVINDETPNAFTLGGTQGNCMKFRIKEIPAASSGVF